MARVSGHRWVCPFCKVAHFGGGCKRNPAGTFLLVGSLASGWKGAGKELGVSKVALNSLAEFRFGLVLFPRLIVCSLQWNSKEHSS